jgi:hypothetical protein
MHSDRRRTPAPPVRGGRRATDPPLTTRHVADWMGRSTSWVRGAIDEGVWVPGGLVRLRAETMVFSGRRTHRIHLDEFIDFLGAIGWKRIPRHPRDQQHDDAVA